MSTKRGIKKRRGNKNDDRRRSDPLLVEFVTKFEAFAENHKTESDEKTEILKGCCENNRATAELIKGHLDRTRFTLKALSIGGTVIVGLVSIVAKWEQVADFLKKF